MDDNPGDLGFLLKIWPEFDGHIKILTYEYFIGVLHALRSLTDNELTRFLKKATLDIEKSAKDACMEKNPEMYFHFEVKYRSKGNLEWIHELMHELPEDQDLSTR